LAFPFLQIRLFDILSVEVMLGVRIGAVHEPQNVYLLEIQHGKG